MASSDFGRMLSVGAIRFEDRFCASRKGGTGGGGWDRGRWVGQGEVGGTGGGGWDRERWVGQGEVGGTGRGGWDRERWVGAQLWLTVHDGGCSCL